jgi:hypothetical protein
MTATPSTISGTLDVLRQPVTTVAPSTLPTDIFNILRGGAAVVGELAGQQQSMDMMREDARRRAEAWAEDAINEDARQTERDQRQQDRMALEADKVERERLSTLRGTYLDGARPEVIRLVERLNRNDPALLPVVGDTPDARAAWAESFASNVATSLQLPPEDVADARRDIAARVQELLSNKSTNIDQDAEASRHFFIGQELRSESMSPLDFRVRVDDMQANARYASPEDLLGQVVAPALRDIAQSGNVTRVKAIVDAMGYAKSPTTQAFAEDIVQVAEVAKARLASQQQSELRSQYTLGLLNAGDDTGKLTALAETIKMQANTGAITPEFAVQMTDTISSNVDRIRRSREKELQDLVERQQVEQAISFTAASMLAGNGAPDPRFAEKAWQQIVAQTQTKEVTDAQMAGRDPREALARTRESLVEVAVKNSYIPDQWRSGIDRAVRQINVAANTGQPLSPAEAENLSTNLALYAQARARDRAYAARLAGGRDGDDEGNAATMEALLSQMELPGTTMEQAAQIVGRRRLAATTSVSETDAEVVAVDENPFNAAHVARITNAYTARGMSKDKALERAKAMFEEQSIELNGQRVYMGLKDNLFNVLNSAQASDVQGSLQFLMQDIAAKAGEAARDAGGEVATGTDLSLTLNRTTGMYMVYDTRTNMPMQPRTPEEASLFVLSPADIARLAPNPVQRREEQRRRMEEVSRQLGEGLRGAVGRGI